MITRERIYVLRHISKNQICAISEYEEFIVNYIDLFKDYFGEDYEIQKVVNTMRINRYLIEYQDYHLFQRGLNNKLTLTEWEWRYYREIFKSLYDRMKDTIINLKLFGDIFQYREDKTLANICEPLSEELYDITKDMYEFIGNLPIEYIKRHILNEPIVAHEDNDRLIDIHLAYLEKIY